MKMEKIKSALFCLAFMTCQASAASFSAAQIAQFKQLPQAEQQALAKQYGVSLSDLTSSSSSAPVVPQETIQPRTVNVTNVVQSPSQASKSKSSLIDFGYDLFAGQPSSYTPVDDLPAPNNYMIAPGDEIKVQLFGNQNQNYTLNVSRDGSVQFPSLGPIQVAGQEFSELKRDLTERIKKQILGVNVSITLGSLRTMQVYVAGDVYQPGAYNVPSLATVTQALIAAGGFRKTGSLRNVIVRRDHEIVNRLDLYNLLLQGNTDNDVRLQPGDTVFVEAKGPSATITGQVRRPAVYETKSGETLGNLLRNAGGSEADAYLQQVEVKRYQANGVHLITADLTTATGRDLVLKDGDRIRLKKVSDQLKNTVLIRGAVTRQGAYEYYQGMKIADLFSSASDDLLPNTDQNYALVVRETGSQRQIKVLQFSLAAALSSPENSQNLTLQDNDQIFVFSDELNVKAWLEPKAVDHSAAPGNSKGAQVKKELDPTTGVQLVKESQVSTNLFESQEENGPQAAGPDSRQALLKPIIDRLRQQAINGQPLQIYEVSGEVTFPGAYPLVENASLKSALAAAGGLLESASKDQAELTRAVIMPGEVALNHHKFDLSKILSNQVPDFRLVSKDRIEIQRKTNWSLNNEVEIQGEVRHPGTYTIGKGETIADLVARAGGMTQYAYPVGAIFSREVLRVQEQQRMKMLSENLRQEIASLALRRQTTSAQYTTSPTDALSVVKDLNTVPAMGRLVINLPSILRGDETQDVMLENGDKLFIPKRANTITIVGEVRRQGSHGFQQALDINDYLALSAGLTKRADDASMYIVKANGAVVIPNTSLTSFSQADANLQPGDTIVVPVDAQYKDSIPFWRDVTQIIYQGTVAIAAIAAL